MSVLRRGSSARSASSEGPASTVVLSDTSPYGSRRLAIETDGVTTVGYLRDAHDTVVGAVWIANHRQAGPDLDLPRLEAGLTPVMPAGRTAHPEGRAGLDPAALEVVWFEEGDGAAVLESGEPLCVIPVWSDMNRGIPGYSRDTTAQTPFALPLRDELGEFAGRIEQSKEHWRWRAGAESWAQFQQHGLGHLLSRLGPGGHYWHDVCRQWRGDHVGNPAAAASGSGPGSASSSPASGSAGGSASGSESSSGTASGSAPAAAAPTGPVVGVSERPACGDRTYAVLSTIGMSCQRMPTVELYKDDVSAHTRIELALATTLPSRKAGAVFPWLAGHPWRAITWLAPGDVLKWPGKPGSFPLGAQWDGVLLLDDPGRLAGPAVPGLNGFTFGGDLVRWLWVVPVTAEDRAFAKEEGSNALIRKLAGQRRNWVTEA